MIAPALWLGQRSERARGVAEQDHAQHALGVALGDVADGADDDARGIGGRGAIDGYERAVVVEVVLDELAGRMTGRWRAAAPAGARSRPGCRMPRRRAATIRRAPSSSGCSGSRRRLADLDDDALAHEREEAQHAVAHRAVGLAQPTARRATCSIPRPSVLGARRRITALISSGERSIDRPDVQLDAVPLQPPARRAASLEAADRSRGPRTSMRSSSGSAATRPCCVAHRRQVAHLGEREQPLVLRRSRARRRGTRRRPPATASRSRREVLQPPQLQSVRHHRVQSAEHLVLDEPLGGVAEGERVDGGHAAPALGLRDRDHDPVQRGGQRDGRQSVAQLGGELLVRRRLAAEIGVEVEHREVVARERGGVAGEGVGQGTDVVELDVGSREVAATALERIAARSAAGGRRWTRGAKAASERTR